MFMVNIIQIELKRSAAEIIKQFLFLVISKQKMRERSEILREIQSFDVNNFKITDISHTS